MSMSDPGGEPRALATDPDDTAGVGASAFARHTKFFKKQHLFVEMDELRQKVERDRKSHRFDRVEQWVETHRWNFGLQEDLNEVGERVWNHPHLPWCSAHGLVELQSLMRDSLVLLDVPGRSLATVAAVIAERLVQEQVLDVETSAKMVQALLLHSSASGSRQRRSSGGTSATDLFAEDGAGKPKGASRTKQTLRTRSRFDDDFALGRAHDRARDEEEFELLCPEELEEAADVLVADVDWLEADLVVFVRLMTTLDIRLERHAKARFLVLVMGPAGDDAHERHVQVGEAAAALLQDEVVVAAAYSAEDPAELLEAIAVRMNKLTVVPHIHRPTDQGVQKRLHKFRKEMLEASSAGDDVWVGGEWDEWEEDAFKTGYTLHNAIRFIEKYAIPLVAAMIAALVIKNVDADWYTKLESAHHSSDSGDTSDGDHATPAPTMFGLVIDGHPVTLHFLVNDVLMNFHFAIAVEEITESFLPGSILFPPTKAAVNPLGATLAGVVIPAIVFFILCYLFETGGAFDDVDYSVQDVIRGWAIPTATDIPPAWSASLLAFGRGHPAIKYLLLLSVVDDVIGIGLIAAFYPDPDNPFKPAWTLLVFIAMFVAWLMRQLPVMDWRPYVFVAGPIAWYGMLRSRLHPALALVFIVPFMPSKLSTRMRETLPTVLHGGLGFDNDANVGLISSSSTAADTHLLPEDRLKIPLFAFEHSIKGYVDFFIVPLFVVCAAGVAVTVAGPFTAIIYLSSTIGKTLGIGGVGWLLARHGFPPPPGMTTGSLFLVGYLASVGLTVAIFVCGAAFPHAGVEAQIQAEAKLGVLVVFVNAIVGVCIGRAGCGTIIPVEDKGPSASSSTDAGDATGVFSSDVNEDEDEDDDDEFLEHVFAIDFVDQLQTIHGHVRDVEEETGLSRKTLRERLHERQQEFHREEDHVKMTERRRTVNGGQSDGKVAGGSYRGSATVV